MTVASTTHLDSKHHATITPGSNEGHPNHMQSLAIVIASQLQKQAQSRRLAGQ
jgi:hypothetical protein